MKAPAGGRRHLHTNTDFFVVSTLPNLLDFFFMSIKSPPSHQVGEALEAMGGSSEAESSEARPSILSRR